MTDPDLDPQLAALQELSRPAIRANGEYGQMAVGLPPQRSPEHMTMQEQQPADPTVLRQAYTPSVQKRAPLAGASPATQETQQAPQMRPQVAQQERGFDWGRALTAFSGRDVGAYDARHRYQQEAPMRQAMEQEQLSALQSGNADKAFARQNAMALIDPSSAQSKQHQDTFSSKWNQMASAPGLPEQLANSFKEAAARSSASSGAELARIDASLTSLFQNVMSGVKTQNTADLAAKKMGLDERGVAAQEAMVPYKQADMQQDNAFKGAQLQETRRHNQASEGHAAAAANNKPPTEAAVKSYQQANDAIVQASEALRLLDGKDALYTGLGGEKLNQGASQLPDMLDWRSDDGKKLGRLLGQLSGETKHDFYGATQTARETADGRQFIPSAAMNKETLRNALKAVLDKGKRHVGEQEALHPVLRKAQQAGEQAVAPQAGARKAPEGSKPGQRFKSKSTGKILEVQSDMTLKEVAGG